MAVQNPPINRLLDAITRSNITVVDTVLDTHPELVNALNDTGDRCLTPLLQASWTGSVKVVDTLLKRGSEVCGMGKLAMTRQSGCQVYRALGGYGGMDSSFPLYVAALKGSYSVVSKLLRSGAAVNQVTSGGQTSLHAACFLGELEDLLSSAHLSVMYEIKDTPTEDFTMIIISLIDNGADVNIQDNNGKTPLHVACRYGSPELVLFLIEKGADVSVKDNYGHSVLEIAAMYDPNIIDVLLDRHAWTQEEIINAFEITGDMEYMIAATVQREQHDYPKKLCEPLEYYKFAKEWENLSELEDHGEDPEWVWQQSRLARERVFDGRFIHFECEFTEPDDAISRSQEISVLARHCLELCKRNNDYMYFVSRSSATGQLLYELTLERELDALETGTVMELIGLAMESAIQMRERLEQEVENSCTEDLICQLERTLEVIGDLVSVLIERRRVSTNKEKADNDFIESNLRRLMYKIPFVRSASNGYIKQLLHILISKKYEAILWNYYLRMPDPEMVKILLNLGNDINAVDSDGNTLLHIVVSLFSAQKDLFARESLPDAIIKITNLLLDAGIDIHAKNKSKRTALEVIKNCGHYKKDRDSDMQNCISLIQQCDRIPTLKILVAQNIHKYKVSYQKYLPHVLKEFVNQH